LRGESQTARMARSKGRSEFPVFFRVWWAMELTELTVKLLLLFFPGIVCHLIVDALARKKDEATVKFLVPTQRPRMTYSPQR